MDSSPKRLCICYVHGLDRRWITPDQAPRLAGLLGSLPHVTIDTIPTNELVSTLITGAEPRQHGLWQATLRDDVKPGLLDRLPDLLTTTWQCIRYRFDSGYEVPAIPRWRRRRLRFHRFKYTKWMKGGDRIKGVAGFPTLFDQLGDHCRFGFGKDFEQTRTLLAQLPGPQPVDFFQTYAFDLFQHWNLDRRDDVLAWLLKLDGWLGDLADRCAEQGVPLLLLADHGQAPVTNYIDLAAKLKALPLHRTAFTWYLEAHCARFWFHTEEARERVTELLRSIGQTRLLQRDEMAQFGMDFDDDRYGECFLYTDHGTLFFPHDFYQPLANKVMARKEKQVMGRRGADPRQKGYHGHLPVHVAEEGFLLLTDHAARPARQRIKLTDFAPTVLSLTDQPTAEHMHGKPAFDF